MNKKVVIIGAILAVLAVALVVVGQLQGGSAGTSTSVPMPSSNNPNDPAVKGLNLN